MDSAVYDHDFRPCIMFNKIELRYEKKLWRLVKFSLMSSEKWTFISTLLRIVWTQPISPCESSSNEG
jgi:hypothetical protein